MKKLLSVILSCVLLLSSFSIITVYAETGTEINYDKLDYRLFNKIDSMEDEQFYVHWDIDDSNYSVVYNVQQIFNGETDKFFYIDEESSYAETWMTKAQIAEVSSYKNTRAVYYLWSTKLDDDIIKRKTSSDLENVLKTMTDTETLRVNVVTNSNNVSPAYSKDIIIKTVPRLENSNIVEGALNLYKQEILDLISCDYVRYLYYNVDDMYESKVERWGSFQLNQTCENVTSDCASNIITPAGNREITYTPNDGYTIDEYTVTVGGRDWTAQSTSFKDNELVVSLYYTYADVDINVKAVPYSETDVTEATEPTAEATEPSTEVTQTTEPTAETTESTEKLPPTYSDKEVISGDYKYFKIDDYTVKIRKYLGTDTKVTVPAEIDGYDVIMIDLDAFENCNTIETLVIPHGIERIDQLAFKNCKNLTNIKIGKDVSNIDAYSFRGCESIKNISINHRNSVYDSRDNCNAIIESKTDTILIGCSETVIPDTVKNIGTNSFEDCINLTKIEIPTNIERIGTAAFRRCVNLENVSLQSGLTRIDDCVFEGCVNLKAIEIPATVKKLGNTVFRNCSSLTEITLPESITSLNNFLFCDCSNLKIVNLSSKTERIGCYTFCNCNSLETISLPKSLRYIDSDAFYNCNSLETISLPKSLRYIDSYAFYNCNNLKEVFYEGTASDWENIHIGIHNDVFDKCNFHFAEEPTTETTEPTTEATKPTEPNTTPTEGTEPTEPVEKKANPVKVTVKNTTVSAKKLESKKQTVKPITVKDAKGTVEVVKVKSGTTSKIYKKITVNKKTGAITFSKGKYSKKTYNIKLKITAKGNSEYKSKVITKTVKVKVK
ncbi:MAG: leucine-rich repeat domain-containing protein [Ruminococcus sp.]